MPELPEVEVTRLSFASQIAGATVLSAYLGKPLRWPLQCDVDDLKGLTVLGVRRRGKYLLLDLAKGTTSVGLLLMHLGMSGSLHFNGCKANTASRIKPPLGKHDHFELVTNKGVLKLNDPRRFGAVVFASSEQSIIAQKLLGKLGVEPLSDSFDAKQFHTDLKRKQASIKQVLLAGELVVGVGNIYASEALFLAGIRPTTSASKISSPRVMKLHAAIQDVLTRAIVKGGSTLQNFSSAKGENGYFQLEANVYDRAGFPCTVCKTPIKRIVQGQRSSFYCPTCQKP
ncbi:MAG TPA: bifunctional DNA-formamidopyrimidine glycosylase/DNA-(apurinic or apyrimidinic site) lyase [Burkholderiaceae bacterium]|mgnify:CR=1 FL=1|nr:bifunctional DNA-formamidopyrimidine glycosylase/DNA-(apurinic or apyrimidinic site) lyase [Burkholderiaceae bacterium]